MLAQYLSSCKYLIFMEVMIEVSARHAHLSREAVDCLFGENYELTPKKPLSQPGQYLCEERVDIVGPKFTFKNVAVLGPIRKNTQVEMSITDTIKMGVNHFIRESGDISETESCKIVGQNGEFEIKEGLIVAKRHIHMTPKDAEKIGAYNGQIAKVVINSLDRSTIYDDVVIRINPNFSLAMHIDTDEGNAINYKSGIKGEVLL